MWDALPLEIVEHIWALRRRSMAEALFRREFERHWSVSMYIWPMGADPYLPLDRLHSAHKFVRPEKWDRFLDDLEERHECWRHMCLPPSPASS